MTSFIIAVSAIIFFIVLLQLWMQTKARRSVGSTIPTELSNDDFYQGKDKKLLFFFSPSCGPCKRMMPDVDELRTQYPDKVKKINVGQSLELSRALKIMATPTSVMVQDRKVLEIKMGMLNRKQIEGLIDLV